MERSKIEGKEVVAGGGGGGGEEEEEEEDDKKKVASPSCRKGSGGSGGSAQPRCQVDNCTADMTDAKNYYRRHKVCQLHSQAPFVLIAGNSRRFCQQCSRFHELSEFDEAKRSCRRRLAGHNERRRRSAYESYEGGHNPQ